jgi:hypothetical protein
MSLPIRVPTNVELIYKDNEEYRNKLYVNVPYTRYTLVCTLVARNNWSTELVDLEGTDREAVSENLTTDQMAKIANALLSKKEANKVRSLLQFPDLKIYIITIVNQFKS